MLYDKVESVIDPLDDVLSKNVIHEVIDWTQSDPLMQQITDSNAVYLIGGHSLNLLLLVNMCLQRSFTWREAFRARSDGR